MTGPFDQSYAGRSDRAALARLANRADGRAGSLGDLAFGPVRIPGELEVDDCGRAQLRAIGGADVVAGTLDRGVDRALAAADQAVVEAVDLVPVRGGGGPEALRPAADDLAAGAGELLDLALLLRCGCGTHFVASNGEGGSWL